jgi:hypothetical protein
MDATVIVDVVDWITGHASDLEVRPDDRSSG